MLILNFVKILSQLYQELKLLMKNAIPGLLILVLNR